MKSQILVTHNRALKHAIVDSGRTQRAIARTARIDETRLSRITTGQIQPIASERKRLARILQRSQADLFPMESAA